MSLSRHLTTSTRIVKDDVSCLQQLLPIRPTCLDKPSREAESCFCIHTWKSSTRNASLL